MQRRTVMEYNEAAWLRWLGRFRAFGITLLLGIQLAISPLMSNAVPLGGFVTVIVLWYTIAAFFLILHRLWGDFGLQARLQVFTDLAFVTSIVYLTGGVDSSFNFLYPLIIIIASIMLPRYWAFVTAALSFICFGSLVELTFFEVIRSYSPMKADLRTVQAAILINFAGYIAVAYLASTLAARLRSVNAEFEEQTRTLDSLRSLHEAIVTCTSEGLIATDLGGRITLLNPAAEQLLGRTRDACIGQALDDIFGQPVASAADAEIRLSGGDGNERILGMSVSLLSSPENKPTGLLYVVQDLTDVRRLQREVRTRDRMAAIGRMAAGIAHEIRNPLTSIAGSAMMLREEAAADSEQATLLDIVIRESERLNNIVGDFLAYSRDKDFHFDLHDLVPLLEDTARLLEARPDFIEGRMTLVRHFKVAEAPAIVDCDRIKQVFWNICHNALRAMQPGGGTLRLGICGAGGDWRISIGDTGIGLTETQQEKMFEPFQSAFAGGTGLGLAIVYQIVQAHEGNIQVSSQPGSGTEFAVTLRRAHARAVAVTQGR